MDLCLGQAVEPGDSEGTSTSIVKAYSNSRYWGRPASRCGEWAPSGTAGGVLNTCISYYILRAQLGDKPSDF